MSDLQTLNSVAKTVSDKVSSAAQSASGAVVGVMGSVSSGVSAFGTALGQAAGPLGAALQKAGNLSPAALSGVTAQVVQALQPTSIYRGLQRFAPVATEIQPTDTRKAQTEVTLKFPSDLGVYYIQIAFTSFSQPNPLSQKVKTDPVFIQLPMSPQLSESYQANYKTDSLGVLGGAASTILEKFEKSGGGFNQSAEAVGAGIGKGILGYIKSDEGKSAGTALLAQSAISATGGVGSAVSRALGASINPNMAVMFDNINFRSK